MTTALLFDLDYTLIDYDPAFGDALAGDHPLGVVTNGHGPNQRRKLEATGLDGYVETMVSPEQVESFKPDPPLFEEAMRRLPADEYVVVGDSIDADVRGADDLGLRTVLVGDGGVDVDPAELPEVDLHVPEFQALGRIRRLVG